MYADGGVLQRVLHELGSRCVRQLSWRDRLEGLALLHSERRVVLVQRRLRLSSCLLVVNLHVVRRRSLLLELRDELLLVVKLLLIELDETGFEDVAGCPATRRGVRAAVRAGQDVIGRRRFEKPDTPGAWRAIQSRVQAGRARQLRAARRDVRLLLLLHLAQRVGKLLLRQLEDAEVGGVVGLVGRGDEELGRRAQLVDPVAHLERCDGFDLDCLTVRRLGDLAGEDVVLPGEPVWQARRREGGVDGGARALRVPDARCPSPGKADEGDRRRVALDAARELAEDPLLVGNLLRFDRPDVVALGLRR